MTWNTLKWIAVIAMALDHISAAILMMHISYVPFIPGLISLPDMMRLIGRIAFPIFAYGIAQGCVYTKSQTRYILRLLIFGIISEVPYQLALNNGTLHRGLFNVFFTLSAGATCCWSVEFCKKKKLWIAVFPVLMIVVLCEALGTDYGGMGVLCIVIPYVLFQNKKESLLALSILLAVFYIITHEFTGFSAPMFSWMYTTGGILGPVTNAVAALGGVFLLALYRGKSGSKRYKWLFYLFYPSHLIIIYLVTRII